MFKKLLSLFIISLLSISNVYSAITEIDYAEYSSDANAQAAYVTSSAGGLASGGKTYTGSTAHPTYPDTGGTELTDGNVGTADYTDTKWQGHYKTTANPWFRIDMSNEIGLQRVRFHYYVDTGSSIYAPTNLVVSGSNDDSSYTTIGTFEDVTDWATSNGAQWSNYLTVTYDSYRYVKFTFTHEGVHDWFFVSELQVYCFTLQSYTESTIKSQGSYSLKGVSQILQTGKTLTKTFSSTIDLSVRNILKFDVYSNRTGSNLKFGLHDTGGTTTEITPNITDAGQWQTVTWDISGVTSANKDVIDKFIITPTNTDSANTFYVDNFYYGGYSGQVIVWND